MKLEQLSDREWEVLTALWERPEGETLGPLTKALEPGTGWSRNTVHTYLTRMETKGFVSIDKEHTPHRYRAAVTREECTAQQRRSLLQRAYEGSAGKLVAAFLQEEPITAAEREELRRLLDEMDV